MPLVTRIEVWREQIFAAAVNAARFECSKNLTSDPVQLILFYKGPVQCIILYNILEDPLNALCVYVLGI